MAKWIWNGNKHVWMTDAELEEMMRPDPAKPSNIRCTCGAEIADSPFHYRWCQKDDKRIKVYPKPTDK